ncbi:GNAT family N-acetyltransferase [Methanooceanicella nereidis]|nr:GNAT family N-acetyltransferase [Methanocella sp. CWC-04]
MSAGTLSGDGYEIGMSISAGVMDVLEEAIRTLFVDTGNSERAYVSGLVKRMERGEISAFTLSHQGKTIGVIFYRMLEQEAELIFGYLLAEYRGAERYFLSNIVNGLQTFGIHIVRSSFTWPDSEGFIRAAADMGFVMIERKSMALNTRKIPLFSIGVYNDVKVCHWNSKYFDDVSRIMCDEAAPADKVVYPLFASYEGSKVLLQSIIENKHGTFMPELSMVAVSGNKTAGFLLSSVLVDGSVLILDIAVSRKYRKMGIGSLMLDHLINKCIATGIGQIVLAVTSVNTDAIQLYVRKGFKEMSTFKQYVLCDSAKVSGKNFEF